jgi:hypothetical protein
MFCVTDVGRGLRIMNTNFDLTSVLKVIGPAASIIFAAWIFMGFVQQRYDAAVDRYRSIIGQYRSNELSSERRGNIRYQVTVYRRRCILMNSANLIGLISAILLIFCLIMGEMDILVPNVTPIKYLSAGSALLGFTLVIVAAGIIVAEGLVARRQLDSELLDVSDLAEAAHQRPGDITSPDRAGGLSTL